MKINSTKYFTQWKIRSLKNNIAVFSLYVHASGRVVENVDMSIRRYFKPVSGLPDPRGHLSQSIPPAAIAEANRLVQEAAQQSSPESMSRKGRPYSDTCRMSRVSSSKWVSLARSLSAYTRTYILYMPTMVEIFVGDLAHENFYLRKFIP